MIKCTIPDSYPLLEFADYGCYCGLGGGGTAVDELDRFIRLCFYKAFTTLFACLWFYGSAHQFRLSLPCL